MPVFPADATDLTRLLVVSDLDRSIAWYRDVLGAELVGEYGGTSAVFRFVGCWLLLVTGGGPTADKPTVTMAAPADPDTTSAELIVAVPDCRAAHAELVHRGASFLAAPVGYPWEIRAFFRDPDGHLFEISERKPRVARPVPRSRRAPESPGARSRISIAGTRSGPNGGRMARV
ncbi:MAG TPA: VOC family protein [Candidatus Limnocylindrales bacterium]